MSKEILMELLPEHKCSLTITHNPHKDFYETVADYCRRFGANCWADEFSMVRAIDSDELWEIQWYPDTPNGFFKVMAPTLEEALELTKHIKK